MLSENDFTVAIGDFVRRKRRECKMTSEDLAWDSSLDYSTINLVENGRHKVKAYSLYKMLSALHVDVDSVLLNKESRDELVLLMDKVKGLEPKQILALSEFISSFELYKK